MNVAPSGWEWPAALLAVVVVVVVWGLLLSPKARVPLPRVAAFALEAVLFVGTGFGLAMTGQVIAATIGVTVWIVHRIALAVLRRR